MEKEREDYLKILFNVCHLPLQKITHIYKSDFETFLIDSNSTYNLLKYQKKKKQTKQTKQKKQEIYGVCDTGYDKLDGTIQKEVERMLILLVKIFMIKSHREGNVPSVLMYMYIVHYMYTFLSVKYTCIDYRT